MPEPHVTRLACDRPRRSCTCDQSAAIRQETARASA